MRLRKIGLITVGSRVRDTISCAFLSHQGRSHPNDSDRKENPEPLSGGNDAQVAHSKDTTSMAKDFEPLNRSLETFLTRFSRTNERSPEGFLRNQDAIKMNLMAALIPG